MKALVLIAAVSFLVPTLSYAHGGGCRKSSPAGMCCHMDNSVGEVHCH